MLTSQQKQHYQRNILLPEIGEEGQLRLLNSKILVIGAGGLGSAALLYLAATGVGCLGIADFDLVELSNLQRQIIHNFDDLGKQKILSAKTKILQLNPELEVRLIEKRLDFESLVECLVEYDLLIDATDNFASRICITKAAHHCKKTLVFAAVKGFAGQLSVFKSFLPRNPCYCCFNQLIDENEDDLPLHQKGIFGAVAGNLGTMQAIAAVKELLQIPQNLVGKLLICDFLKNDFRKVVINKNPDCKICSS